MVDQTSDLEEVMQAATAWAHDTREFSNAVRLDRLTEVGRKNVEAHQSAADRVDQAVARLRG